MNFASDNAGPAHPKVIEALGRANEGHVGSYGADPLTQGAADKLREVLGAPEAAVHFVATGTAANALALACLAEPWSAIFCAPAAHVHVDECNAPEFYTGGAKLIPVQGPDGKIGAASLEAAILAEETRGVHGPQRGPVTLTQATESGTTYSQSELEAIGTVAGRYGVKLHMDGARLANALAASNLAPAQMVERVAALSFGGTKNGLLGAEAVVLFDPELSWQFELRRKRAGHLFSKHRYLAAQMDAYLTDGLWMELASRANAAATRLSEGLVAQGYELAWPTEANMVFFRAPARVHEAAMAQGAVYHLWDEAGEENPDRPVTARLVCDWSKSDGEVDALLALFA
ncbi:threonine aldolase family protein [Pseudoroseicyclus tamaricis]|uniref:Low specificity L-threonine aldolase n=1 Tax=Pseudoroseicyclus tamaricis TaxID=2705421 RepID=A0A6B2JFS2_9RHOB|nr:beta-eliminating lyase-related protein [Pseudoroseicyclus tamaricis]NDU99930.1 low specificity L-threonine aldolase [Pseudoroseicyclus tamaricis]